MKPAVFLDRDGVLTDLMKNPHTGEYEPPRKPDELVIYPDVLESLIQLQSFGFLLFLVSNQPDYAKGKTTLENIRAVHERFDQILTENGIKFIEYYYCFHHPAGIVPEYSYTCECRKPQPYFILKARDQYDIDLVCSWIVGDRDTDIECGKSAGLRTILVDNWKSVPYQKTGKQDFKAANLKMAVNIIVNHSTNHGSRV